MPLVDVDLQTLVTQMTGVFASAKSAGLAIVGGAVGIALVFIAARFGYGLLRRWLAKAG